MKAMNLLFEESTHSCAHIHAWTHTGNVLRISANLNTQLCNPYCSSMDTLWVHSQNPYDIYDLIVILLYFILLYFRVHVVIH